MDHSNVFLYGLNQSPKKIKNNYNFKVKKSNNKKKLFYTINVQ